MKTIKSIDVFGVLSISAKSTNDLADSFVVIHDNINQATILVFKDEIDSIINALQELKKEL